MPNVAQSFFSYINSFATFAKATTSSNIGGIYTPLVPVTLINPKDVKKTVNVAVGAIVDTGAEHTLLQEKYAKAIGFDYKNGTRYNISGAGGNVASVFYGNKVLLKIGTLTPTPTTVLFGPSNDDDNVIGRNTLREYVTTLTRDQIRLAEYVQEEKATKSAYAKALYASFMNSSNAAANYRNRI